jgi:thiamine biosynthesis lipoprotein
LTRIEHIMGMPIVVDIRDDVDSDALDEMFDWLRWVDATFSTYRDDSEVSRLNRGELAVDDVHPDVHDVLQRCEELRATTDGYFDARAGTNGILDPSGLVKGWGVDRAATLLDAIGLENYALSAGGDMVLRGGALPDAAWRVGIQHPLLNDQVAAVVEASDLAVATSGEYARGRHVFDPHTGQPPDGVLSVTITGPDLATADAFATAAFAMGAKGPHWTARLQGHEAMTMLTDERVLSTPGFPAV